MTDSLLALNFEWCRSACLFACSRCVPNSVLAAGKTLGKAKRSVSASVDLRGIDTSLLDARHMKINRIMGKVPADRSLP